MKDDDAMTKDKELLQGGFKMKDDDAMTKDKELLQGDMLRVEDDLEKLGIPTVDAENLVPAILVNVNKSASRSREYNGQPWTTDGIRGKHVITGLTERDILDCVALSLLLLGGSEEHANKVIEFRKNINGDANWSWNDLYSDKLDYNKMDPVAFLQNIGCFMEMYQGIFPNTPKLRFEDVMGAETSNIETVGDDKCIE